MMSNISSLFYSSMFLLSESSVQQMFQEIQWESPQSGNWAKLIRVMLI